MADDESRGSTGSSVRVSDKVTVFEALKLPEVNVAHLRRPLAPALVRPLEELASREGLGTRRAVLELAEPSLDTLFAEVPAPLRPALEHDVRGWIALLGELTGVSRLLGTFGAVSDDSCRRFHTDRVGLRLLCTYAGPGTDYVDDRAVCREALADPPACEHEANARVVHDASSVQRANAGDVLVLKGEAWPDGLGRGAVHRSPPIAHLGLRRLLLTLTYARVVQGAGHAPALHDTFGPHRIVRFPGLEELL